MLSVTYVHGNTNKCISCCEITHFHVDRNKIDALADTYTDPQTEIQKQTPTATHTHPHTHGANILTLVAERAVEARQTLTVARDVVTGAVTMETLRTGLTAALAIEARRAG